MNDNDFKFQLGDTVYVHNGKFTITSGVVQAGVLTTEVNEVDTKYTKIYRVKFHGYYHLQDVMEKDLYKSLKEVFDVVTENLLNKITFVYDCNEKVGELFEYDYKKIQELIANE